jgi:hypothetical protein
MVELVSKPGWFRKKQQNSRFSTKFKVAVQKLKFWNSLGFATKAD